MARAQDQTVHSGILLILSTAQLSLDVFKVWMEIVTLVLKAYMKLGL